MAAELAEADDAARLATAACFASWRERIAQSYGRMRTAGVLRPDTDVEALASTTLAALEGGQLLCKAERSTTSLRAVLAGDAGLPADVGVIRFPGRARWRSPWPATVQILMTPDI